MNTKIQVRVSPAFLFVGGFNRTPDWLDRIPDKEMPGNAKRIYAYLARRAGTGLSARPSESKIGQALGLTTDQVEKGISKLRKAGLIEVSRPNRNLANEYFFPEIRNTPETENRRVHGDRESAGPIERDLEKRLTENRENDPRRSTLRRELRTDTEETNREQGSAPLGAIQFLRYFEERHGPVAKVDRDALRAAFSRALARDHRVRSKRRYYRLTPTQLQAVVDAFEPWERKRGIYAGLSKAELFLKTREVLYSQLGCEPVTFDGVAIDDHVRSAEEHQGLLDETMSPVISYQQRKHKIRRSQP